VKVAAAEAAPANFPAYAQMRDAVEKRIADDPTLLTKDASLKALYSEYSSAAFEVDGKYEKLDKEHPADVKLNARLHDAELLDRTAKIVATLDARLKGAPPPAAAPKGTEAKPAPAAAEEKPVAEAKPAEAKPAPAAKEEKPKEAAKPVEAKPAPAAKEEKPKEAAKPAEARPAPAAKEEKPKEAAKPAEAKPAPAAKEEKPKEAAKPAEAKPAPAPAAKEEKPKEAAKPAEAKPAAAPAAKGKGSLACSSKPAGADIWVDGKNTGKKTPLPVSSALELPAGKHSVIFKLNGKASAPVEVTIEADHPSVLKGVEIP
jgi:hypothetical protein